MTRLRTIFWAGTACCVLFACKSADKATSSTSSSSSSSGSGGHTGAGGASSGVTIKGLSAEVHAAYDPNGLLHLTCATDNDCYAALGYFHASNRFFFMDFVRNLVEGSLGGLVKAGQLVLSQDFVNRQWFSTAQGEPLENALYEAASPAAQGYLNAYTNGVNAWIADMRAGKNGASLTPEYDFPLIVKANIRDWTPQDCAAVGLYVLDDLSDNSASELEAAKDIPLFSPVVAAELFTSRPVFPAYTIPEATGNAPMVRPAQGPNGLGSFAAWRDTVEDAGAVLARVGAGAKAKLKGDIGSNNWALAPSRTANGHALLANDPHLTLMNPSIWFAVELDAKSNGTGSYHVAGSTFPGVPSVMIGQNENIAWGVTTAYYDMADEYLETLSADGNSVLFNGNEVPLLSKQFTFQNAAGSPVTQTFQWAPQHGPIVSKNTTMGTAVSVRWTGQTPGTDFDAFFALGRAGSVNEAQTGLTSYASSASQNFVVVDKTGNVGWFPYSKVPSRPWASATVPPWLPVPGDGSAEWQGWVPTAQLPQLLNPSKGFVATANNDMTGASANGDPTGQGVPAIQAWDKADGTREQRIVDMITAGGNTHTVDTMHTMQGDTYSLYGSVVVPAVLAAANAATLTPAQQAVVTALSSWQFTCPTGLDGTDPVNSPPSADATAKSESIGCTAFHATFYAIVRDALGDEEAKAGVDLSDLTVDIELITRAILDPTTVDQGFWDNVTTTAVETQSDILVQALADAATTLAPLGGPDTWLWGRVHTLTLASVFNSFGVTMYNYGPYAAQGGQFTVNVGNPDVRTAPASGMPLNFAFSAGPSIRMVVDMSPSGPSMTYELPGGADLHRTSQFYNNLLPGWLQNQSIPFPFGPGAVPKPAVTVEVNPAQ